MVSAMKHRALALMAAVVLACGMAFSIVCPAAAYAVEAPTISVPEATTVISRLSGSANIELSVEASATDGGVLSYQWQVGTAVNKSGKNKGDLKDPSDVPGATSPSLELAAEASNGGKYYQCVVTNTLEGESAQAKSKWFFVRIVETQGTWGDESGSGDWTYSPEENKLTISGSGAMPDYANPGSVPWSGVFSVMEPGGAISVSEGITNIGKYSFGSLTTEGVTIGLPKSLESIHELAFYNATGLKTIDIPGSVQEIQSKAFNGAKGLTSVTIPASVTTIGESAFLGCESLGEILFEDGDKELIVSDRAFTGTVVTNVVVPNRCKSIGAYAFMSLYGGENQLKEASIPAGCTFTPSGTLNDSQTGYLDSFPSDCAVSKRCAVTFADSDGSDLKTEVASYVCQGPGMVVAGSASYSGDTPTKASDDEYVYTFAGWVTEQGGSTPADLDAVTGDMTVYASYTAMSKAAAEAKDAIEALPADGVVDSDEDAALVEAATEAYLNLTDEQRAELSDDAVAALVSAQGSLVAYKKAALAAAQEESAKAQAAAAAELEQAKADLAKAQAAAGLKASSLKVTAKAVSAKANKKTKVSAKKAFAVTGAAGNLTYAKLKGSAKISVSAKGKVTVKKGLKKNKTYKVKVLVTDSGSSTVAAANTIVTLKVKVKK